VHFHSDGSLQPDQRPLREPRALAPALKEAMLGVSGSAAADEPQEGNVVAAAAGGTLLVPFAGLSGLAALQAVATGALEQLRRRESKETSQLPASASASVEGAAAVSVEASICGFGQDEMAEKVRRKQ
jgi:hypothetical protein